MFSLNKFRKVGATIIALLVCAALFIAATYTPLSHDEESYVTPAVMTKSQSLYGDFIYLQPPIYPLVLANVFAFSDQDYFAIARLTVFVMAGIAALLMYRLGLAVSNSLIVGAIASLSFVCSQIMDPCVWCGAK